MLKACESHFWLSDLNRTLGSNILAVLAKSASLLGHNRFAALLLSQSLFTHLMGRFLQGDCRHAHSFRLDDA